MDAAADQPFLEQDITMNTGAKMPTVGFGCWKVDKDKCADIVYTAIKNGYRLIDEAADYGNEK